MGMIQEFKEFAMKGNVVDLAIGVVIGGAFGKIVASLIDDVITPLILSPALEAAHLSNIADLKMGVYMVKITDSNRCVKTTRLIKQ